MIKLRNIIIFSVIIYANNVFATNCSGRFINPITDICWHCMFPITIGAVKLSPDVRADTNNPSSPICVCSEPIPRVGLSVGFWEPVRLVDVTKTPFCFVNLGGTKIAPSVNIGTGKAPGNTDNETATWHVHWYVYPIIYWLNLFLDFICLEHSGFDIAYISELDPLWLDDELTFLLNPEAILFANPIAQAACSADCIAASLRLPMDLLFWCAGCQGSMYPLNGRIQSHIGAVQSSLLAAERMTYKLHRQLILWGSIGSEALCGSYPMPIMQKSQYRSQLTNPIASTSILGCSPFGATSSIYEAGKEIPVIGEDFGYLIWRKRNCCVL